MVAQHHACNRQRLELLLADQLNEVEQSLATTHLESCESCRRTLSNLAGDDQWWNDASHYLQNDIHDARGLDGYDSDSLTTSRLIATEEIGLAELSTDFLEPSDNPAMIGRLGEYEILELIGRGGMGVVLKGYQRELNRYVAVKVMAPHYASSGAARKRFAREAQAAAAVVHPHVVAIHTIEASARLPYLVMPFVAGKSLQTRIDEDGPLELKEILRIAKQTAEGLAAAHAQGLVHRDIKPANILLEDDVGRVLLTDFGLARAVDDASMTHSGIIAGTPQYMSPEQARGESIDHRADLFSLGSVLYAMCTGRPPFRAETTMGILRHICEDPPRPPHEVNPEIPVWLASIIERLHAKQASERFESAEEVGDLLGGCLAHVQQPTTVALPEALRKLEIEPSKTRSSQYLLRFGIPISIACLLIIAIGFAATMWPTPAPNSQQTSTESSADQEVIQLDNTEPASPPIWNDGIAEEIGDLSIDTRLLERKSERDWDETAPTLLHRLNLNHQQPTELEPIQ